MSLQSELLSVFYQTNSMISCIQDPNVIKIAVIIYVLSLPFTIREWKHKDWLEKNFYTKEKKSSGKYK